MLTKIFLSIVLITAFAGCTEDTGGITADEVVLGYFGAMVEGDVNYITEYVCSGYEGQARIDFDGFGAVEASLEGGTCRIDGLDGDFARVVCEGSVNVSYDGEANELLDLSDYVYDVVREDGVWRLCGYE